MNKEKRRSGYREIEVTADRGLEIWAPSLEELFISAAEGMLEIAGVRFGEGEDIIHDIELSEVDIETLLVAFLEEIVYFIDDAAIAFTSDQIYIDGNDLKTKMRGKKIIEIDHEIKAVTFNNLKITLDGSEYRVTVVFDL